jgi:hypothetical protein
MGERPTQTGGECDPATPRPRDPATIYLVLLR